MRTTGRTGTTRCVTGLSSTITWRGSTSWIRTSASPGSTMSDGSISSRVLSAVRVSGRIRVKNRFSRESRSSVRREPTAVARSGSSGLTTARPGGGCTRSSTRSSALPGCSLDANSHSSTDNATEVSLSGQSATNAARMLTSGPGLPFVEQAFDQGAVDRRAPVLRPDHALHDGALAIEQEALGYPGGLVGLLDGCRAVLQEVEREMERLAEVAHVGRIALVDADGSNLEPARAERVVESLHGGHLDLARLAPSGPDVHQRHAALVPVTQRHGVTGREIDDLEVRRPSPDRHRRVLRPVLDQCGCADSEPREHGHDGQPLLRHDLLC